MEPPAGATGSPGTPGSPPAGPAFFRRPAGRILLATLALLLVVLLALLAYFYFDGALGENFHVVAPPPNALYRSAQLSGPELQAKITALQIKSVLNLRGENKGKPWYDAEAAAVAATGANLIDVKMSGKHMPDRDRLVALIYALDYAPRPLLVHCQWGSDRTGLACAFERLKEGATFDTARAELTFFPYGHTHHFGYEAMDRVVDQFAAYRQAGGQLSALEWAKQLYDPSADPDEN